MCTRWDSDFRDGREGGGIPLFQTPNGDTQQTGWTGYDCSVPICVQVKHGWEIFIFYVLCCSRNATSRCSMVTMNSRVSDRHCQTDHV